MAIISGGALALPGDPQPGAQLRFYPSEPYTLATAVGTQHGLLFMVLLVPPANLLDFQAAVPSVLYRIEQN
jgi:hypothetical protein